MSRQETCLPSGKGGLETQLIFGVKAVWPEKIVETKHNCRKSTFFKIVDSTIFFRKKGMARGARGEVAFGAAPRAGDSAEAGGRARAPRPPGDSAGVYGGEGGAAL